MYAVSGYQRLHHTITRCKLLMKPDDSWAKNIPLESLTAQYIIIWEEELKNKRNMYRNQGTGFLKPVNELFKVDIYPMIRSKLITISSSINKTSNTLLLPKDMKPSSRFFSSNHQKFHLDTYVLVTLTRTLEINLIFKPQMKV